MKKTFYLILTLILLFSLCACGNGTDAQTTTLEQTTAEQAVSVEETVDDGKLQLIGFESFSGVFIEDGSDRNEENVLALKLRNLTEETLIRATLVFKDGSGEEYTFSVNTLPAGKQVTALEIHAKEFSADEAYTCTSVEATYSAADRLCKDTVSVVTKNGKIYATNVSGKEIGTVYVYYKTLDSDGELFGGVTYRAEFKDLAPSVTLDENTMHFTSSSRVVMVEVK